METNISARQHGLKNEVLLQSNTSNMWRFEGNVNGGEKPPKIYDYDEKENEEKSRAGDYREG